MALSQKVFETLFRINAQWKGQAAVVAAQAGMGRVARSAQTANLRIKGLTSAVFKGNFAYDVFRRSLGLAVQGLTKSITAAEEAQERHDDLGLALQRNAQFYKELAGKTLPEVNAILEANRQALIADAEQMEKTGHDAETLEAGWSKMLDAMAFSPKQMKQNEKAFSDVLSFMYGANATAEESIQLGEEWAATILQGSPAFLKSIKAERSYMNLLRKINLEEKNRVISAEEAIRRRQQLSIRAAAKVAKETERVFATRSGKIAHMWTSIENIFENLGKPFIERSGALAESFDKISTGLAPTAEKLALISDTYLKNIANWLTENKDSIPGWIDRVGTALEMTLKPLTTTYKLLKALYDLGEKMKLPGAAPGTPPTNAATAQNALPWRYGPSAPEPGFQGMTAPGPPVPKAILPAPGKGFSPYQRESAAAAGGPSANATIAAMRAARVAEIQNNPAMKQLFAATIAKEAGTPTGVQAVGEAMFNRAQMRNQSIEKAIRSGFYGPVNRGEVDAMVRQGVPDWAMKQADEVLAKVGGGSNLIEGRTDQGMINEIKGAKRQFGGEWFGYMPGTKAWSEQFNRKASLKDLTSALSPRAGGGSTNNISMSSPITINGVAPGREYAVGRTVRNAMQSPIREFLDSIKKARNEDIRTGYV